MSCLSFCAAQCSCRAVNEAQRGACVMISGGNAREVSEECMDTCRSNSQWRGSAFLENVITLAMAHPLADCVQVFLIPTCFLGPNIVSHPNHFVHKLLIFLSHRFVLCLGLLQLHSVH